MAAVPDLIFKLVFSIEVILNLTYYGLITQDLHHIQMPAKEHKILPLLVSSTVCLITVPYS